MNEHDCAQQQQDQRCGIEFRLCNSPDNGQGTAAEGLITAQEARTAARSLRMVQDLRIRLHFCARRREDRLIFDLQRTVAAELGLVDRPGRLATEQLMERFYRTAAAVRQLSHIVLQNLATCIFPERRSEVRTINDHFCIRGELLDADRKSTRLNSSH